jgi:hypothetical protein
MTWTSRCARAAEGVTGGMNAGLYGGGRKSLFIKIYHANIKENVECHMKNGV